ncbi:carbohydrate-binding module family 20 domain-containing protein [Streptomyces sp. NPDC127190]
MPCSRHIAEYRPLGGRYSCSLCSSPDCSPARRPTPVQQLGSWDLARAIPLGTTASAYPHWAASIRLRVGTTVQCNQATATTNWGQNLYVTGNLPDLGNWDPAKALPPATGPSTYPLWSGPHQLQPNHGGRRPCRARRRRRLRAGGRPLRGRRRVHPRRRHW